MLKKLFSIFKKKRKIAILDGDQPLPEIIRAYDKYIANNSFEVHIIRACALTHIPKLLKQQKFNKANKVFLEGIATGKEATDKYIGAYIQKAIADGVQDITVVSSDYDFVDIFKMSMMISPSATNVTFRLIVPKPRGKLSTLPCQVANIDIVKM